ncbi:MAG: rRNA maturation RNase YbeY [Minisyncoccia bacterium]
MPRFEILVYNKSKEKLPFSRRKLQTIIEKVLFFLKEKKPVSISLIFVDPVQFKKIRTFWLKEDKQGSILSFPYQTKQDVFPLLNQEKKDLGDIFFSIKNLKKEAKGLKVSFKDYFLELLIHGLLHLYGFEHKKKEDWVKMEKKEKLIFKKIKNILCALLI